MDEAPKRGFPVWALVPLLAVAVIGAVFVYGLGRDRPDDLPSELVGRPVPEFALPPLDEGEPGLASADLAGAGVKLLNIWASWCVPCRAEHPIITALAERGIPVYAINYKDEEADARAFLDELGDPYRAIGADTRGRVFIEWGAFGVPETFVIDGAGRIVYRHPGPIAPSDVEKFILPAIERARANGG